MRKALGLLVLAVSCAPPPAYYTPTYPPLDRVRVGDSSEKVLEVMGKPTGRTNGWWRNDRIAYSTEYHVWSYRGVGRIIFDRGSRKVVATEADPHDPGDGDDDRM